MKRHPEGAAAWLCLILPALICLAAHKGLALGLSKRLALWDARLSATQAQAAATALASVLLMPAALAWARREARLDGEARTRFDAPSALPGILAGLALGLVTAMAARLLPSLASESTPLPAGWAAVRLIALCAAGPLLEEAVYRDLTLHFYRAILSPAPALLLSSALFAAGHGGAVQMAAAFAGGLVFGSIYLYAQKRRPGAGLPAAALCHAAANLAQLILMK